MRPALVTWSSVAQHKADCENKDGVVDVGDADAAVKARIPFHSTSSMLHEHEMPVLTGAEGQGLSHREYTCAAVCLPKFAGRMLPPLCQLNSQPQGNPICKGYQRSSLPRKKTNSSLCMLISSMRILSAGEKERQGTTCWGATCGVCTSSTTSFCTTLRLQDGRHDGAAQAYLSYCRSSKHWLFTVHVEGFFTAT